MNKANFLSFAHLADRRRLVEIFYVNAGPASVGNAWLAPFARRARDFRHGTVPDRLEVLYLHVAPLLFEVFGNQPPVAMMGFVFATE